MPIDLLADNNSESKNNGVDLLSDESELPKKKSRLQKLTGIAEGLGAGALEDVLSAGSTVNRGLTALYNKTLGNLLGHLEAAGKPEFEAIKKIESEHPIATKIGEFGGALAAPPLRVLRGTTFARELANAAATGAGYSTLFGDPKNLKEAGEDATLGALLGGAVHGGITGVTQLPKIIRNTVGAIARKTSEKKPEEIVKDMMASQGLPVSISDIYESPILRDIYHNWLGNIVGSGVTKANQKLVKGADEEASRYVDALRNGADEENIPHHIIDEIENTSRNNESKKSENYLSLAKEADEAGLDISNRPKTEEFAKKTLKSINNKNPKDIIEMGNIVKELQRQIEPHELEPQDLSRIVDKSGKPINKPQESIPSSFQDAALKYKSLNEKAEELASKGKRYEALLHGTLADKLEEDIKDTILNSKNKELYNLLKQHDEHFKNEVLPYREKDIQNLIKDKSNLSNLFGTLTNTKNSKILEDLSPENKKRLFYRYLTKGTKSEDITPSNISKKLNKLSPEIKKILLSNDELSQLENIGRKGKLTEEARKQLKNFPTGVQNIRSLLKILPYGAGALSYLGGDVSGGDHSLLPSKTTLALLALPMLLGRGAANVMRNPKTIEASLTGGEKLNTSPMINPLIRGLTGLFGGK